MFSGVGFGLLLRLHGKLSIDLYQNIIEQHVFFRASIILGSVFIPVNPPFLRKKIIQTILRGYFMVWTRCESN